jgi:hypothetical protein
MPDPFQRFYRTAPLDLGCLTDLPHRHFRFFLKSGRFLKVDRRIRNEERFRSWLVQYGPRDVYYSVSCWLNPEILGRRTGTPLTANIILSSDIVFDIDRSPFTIKNLEEARRDTFRLVRFLAENRYEIRYIAFSGSKGFHVVCRDPGRYPFTDPFEREDQIKAARSMLLDSVISEGIRVDGKVTLDTRRIFRVPGTINSKTGYVCVLLSESQLSMPAKEILKTVPRISISTPWIPFRGNDVPLRGLGIIHWLLDRFGVRWGAAPFSYASFITSRVPGVSRLIPFFEYPARISPEKAEHRLMAVQDEYGLSDIYLFKSKSSVSAICLSTFQRRRVEKIVRASGSRDYGTLLKYGRQFFRVGSRMDVHGHETETSPVFIMTIPADNHGNLRFVSSPHREFLARFSVPVRTYQNTHGTGPVLMSHTIVEH